MPYKTTIPWCDSTFNLQMGCRGCELWNSRLKVCYAGKLTEIYQGQKGWPDAFDQPKIFPERMSEIKSWSDLRGVERDDKPWIPARFPRLVFFNDMGDTFTNGLPVEWLAEYIYDLKRLPHVLLVLTKNVTRMNYFFSHVINGVPHNFALGTSITDQRTTIRIDKLAEIQAPIRFLSIEPAIEKIDLSKWFSMNDVPFDWVIMGGENGERPFQHAWARFVLDQCIERDIPFFMKQLGGEHDRRERMTDFPIDLRVRMFPAFEWLAKNNQLKLL